MSSQAKQSKLSKISEPSEQRKQFISLFKVGGKANSLGQSAEVLALVLSNRLLIEELYMCLFDQDAWVRMRAADTLEKVCRIHPEWIEEYIDQMIADLSKSTQASIQWHLAQIYRQVSLSMQQKIAVIDWLVSLLATTDVDWIVAANAMDTLAQFTKEGSFSKVKLLKLLDIQSHHHSKSVVKRVNSMQASLV